jgi:hypothetical protein
MLIKKGMSLKDPNRESNIKHTTPNEIMSETRKRKQKKYKISSRKTFVSYADGQYEEIFKKK